MPCGRAWLCWDSGVSERKPYPSDLSDERWALIEPVITAWKAAHPSVSGHQGGYAMREIVNAILYQGRTGCQWDYLPHDLPPRSAVYYYFATWRDDGTDQAIHDLLRWQAREKRGRLADPSLVVLDTQSVHAAAGVPASTTGKDAGKRVPGRKRGLAVDVLGLVIAVVALAASAHDNTAGIALLGRGRRAGRHGPHGARRPGVQERGRRAWRHARHRRADRRAQPGRQGIRPPAQAVGGGADLRHPGPAPAPGPRL
jgi:transposase